MIKTAGSKREIVYAYPYEFLCLFISFWVHWSNYKWRAILKNYFRNNCCDLAQMNKLWLKSAGVD